MDGRRAVIVAGAAAAIAVVALVLGFYRFHHDRLAWSPDGAIYLRMTLADRGEPPDRARQDANAFMRTTPEGRAPESAGFYTDTPPEYYREQFALFRTRPLYPALAAALYGHAGPDALKLVSVGAYVAAAVLFFGLLIQLVPARIAMLGALGFATAPHVLGVAALPLTDELALALWVGALASMIAYLRTRAPAWLITLVAVTAVLAFVRPAVYLPLGAALGAFLAAPRGSAVRAAALRAIAAIGAIAVVFVVFTALVHGPGIAEQLRWVYDWQRVTHGPFTEHGFVLWWLASIAAALAEESVVEIYRNGAWFTMVLAGFGIVAARRSPAVPVAAGAAVATLAPIVLNPVEVLRTVTLPLTPVLILLATLALAQGLAARRPAAGEARTPRAG